MDAFTTQQTVELVSRIGTKKSHMRLDKLWWNSVICGPLLGFGCAVLLSTETAPWYQENAPGLIRSIGALFFPVGLVMIVMSGADLVTSNIMFMTVALLHRRISILDLLKSWVVSFFGNLAGMLFFVCIITGYGGVFDIAAYRQETLNFATAKILIPQWHQIFLRAIGANWLVCFAVFMSLSSREVVSKIFAIWFPTATFVALGLDHVVANMYFIPIAIWNSHPDIGVGMYIYKSMIPSALGNIVGGGLFVGGIYWYLFLTGEGSVEIDFNAGPVETALEAGGPMGHKMRKQRAVDENNPAVIDGREPSTQLPNSGGYMVSAIHKELSEDKYAKPKGEVSDEEKVPGV